MSDYDEKPKRKPKNDEFFLDPDHKKFKPGVTHFRFEAVYTPYISFGVYFFIGFFLFLFTLICGVAVFGWYFEDTAYAKDGIETTAYIYDCSSIPYKGNSRTYNFSYQFDLNGIIYDGRDTFTLKQWNCNRISPNVLIEYLESNPKTSRIIDSQLYIPINYIEGIIFILFLVGLTALSSRGFFLLVFLPASI